MKGICYDITSVLRSSAGCREKKSYKRMLDKNHTAPESIFPYSEFNDNNKGRISMKCSALYHIFEFWTVTVKTKHQSH